MRAVGLVSPFLWVLVLKLGTLALSMATVVWIASTVSKSLDRPGRRALWLSSLFLWFFPLFHQRFSSENLAGMAFFAAVTLIARAGPLRVTWAGGLLGLAFVFRFQMAFSILPLLVWFAVSFGCGILLVEPLNRGSLAGFPLGFWFAQQGSIYVFVVLILVYALWMDRLDRRYRGK